MAIAALVFVDVANAVSVDGIYYYVPSISVSSLGVSGDQLEAATVSGGDLVPLTVINGNFSTLDASALKSTISSFIDKDDVFSTGFNQRHLRHSGHSPRLRE
jgi:hypothetical protein